MIESMKAGTMTSERDSAKLFASLLIFWIMLNGTLAIDTLIIGVLACLAITYFFRDSLSYLTDFKMTPQAFVAAIKYFFFFLKELVVSNVRIARIVISPDLPINPGIVKVRTKLTSPMGRLLLANSITLTPGTLTVEIEDEWYYIHWVTADATDIEAATNKIVAGFERHLEVMYG